MSIAISPTSYTFTKEEKIIISYTGSLINYGYLYGLGNVTTSESTTSSTLTFPSFNTPGTYECYIGTYIGNDWTTSNSFSIIINEKTPEPSDNPPTISSINDIHSYVNKNVSINYVATDDKSIVRHELSQNGGTNWTTITPSSNGSSYSYDVIYSTVGNRQCKIRVFDSKGQYSTSNNFTIYIEEEPVVVPPNDSLITLYDKDAITKVSDLDDATECLVKEEENGVFELEMIYSIASIAYGEIERNRVIQAKASDELGKQLFRIYYVSEEINGEVIVKAQHITYDLIDNFVEGVTCTNSTCEQSFKEMLNNCEVKHKFNGYSDIEHTATYNMNRVNPLQAIIGTRGSLIDTYGNGAKIKRDNYNIYINKTRGSNNGVVIGYAKNLVGYVREIDETGLVTCIYPYAKVQNQTTEGGESIEETIVLPERFINSKYVNSYPHPKILAIDYSEREVSDIAGLRKQAEKYFLETKKDIPNVNYKVEFIYLHQTVEYNDLNLKSLELVGMGDTVTVVDERIGMNVEANVIKTVFNVLNNRYDSIELGRFKGSLNDIIGDIETDVDNALGQIKNMYVNFEILDDKIVSEVSKLQGDIKTNTTLIQQTSESISQMAKDIEGNTSLIQQTAKDIILRVEGVETSKPSNDEMDKAINDAKTKLSSEITDLDGKINDLNNNINGAIKDGIIDEAEATIIENNLNQLKKEKADIDERYNNLYANTDLIETEKVKLSSAKSELDSKVSSLLSVITTIISDNKVTDSEKAQFNTAIDLYKIASSYMQKSFDIAIDAIAKVKADKAESNANDNANKKFSEIKQTTDDITLKVSGLDGKYTELKQTVDGFNITGMVTFDDLSTNNGTTVIHGGNIRANSISGSKISGGIIEGTELKTAEPTSYGGVWIKQNGMQVGTTSIHFADSRFKIEAQSNMSIASGSGGIYLMPSTEVGVSGTLKCNSLYVNGVQITGNGGVAVFG